jgi:hypothetical protein
MVSLYFTRYSAWNMVTSLSTDDISTMEIFAFAGLPPEMSVFLEISILDLFMALSIG